MPCMRVGQMTPTSFGSTPWQTPHPHGHLNDGEFDFGTPRFGGAESGADGQPAQIPNLTTMVDDLQTQLSSREQQLGVLENLILTRELNKQVYPEGRPVQDG